MTKFDKDRIQIMLFGTVKSGISSSQIFKLWEPKTQTSIIEVSIRVAVILREVTIDGKFNLAVDNLIAVTKVVNRNVLSLRLTDDSLEGIEVTLDVTVV